MSELSQSVVVCNLDGRILLYNQRARLLFRTCRRRRGGSGAELIGLGRSIYTVFDRRLVDHALETFASGCSAASPTRRRSSSPPRRPGSCCACRWRRCAAVTTTPGTSELGGFVLMLDNITQTVRRRGPARHAAARTDRTQPRVARQHPGRHRDARVPRSRRRLAQALPGRDPRRGRRDEPAHPRSRDAHCAGHEDTLAARRHARRRPRVGRRAAHRSDVPPARRDRRRRCVAVAEGRQLFAAAGADLSGRTPARRVCGALGAAALVVGVGPRAARPGLVGATGEHRDGDELGDGLDAHRPGLDAAHGARRRRPPRRRILVRARARAPRGLLSLPAAAGRAASRARGRAACGARRKPARVLRLRPVPDLGIQRASSTIARSRS